MRTFLGAIATIVWLPALAVAGAGLHDVCGQQPRCRAATDAELAGLRGGFEVETRAGRLRLDIGITRGVRVDDRLVAVSHLAIPDLRRPLAERKAAGMNAPPLIQGEALVVQIGPGNFAPPAAAFHDAALPTLVQNTLDNQSVKTFTRLDASLNSLSLMNMHRMAEMMRRATAASGR
jgi:hypothetical protein